MLIDSDVEVEIIKPNIDFNPNIFIGSNPIDIYRASLDVLPEIKSLDLSMKSADYDLKISRSGRYPSISASTSFSTNYSSFADRQRNFYD